METIVASIVVVKEFVFVAFAVVVKFNIVMMSTFELLMEKQ